MKETQFINLTADNDGELVDITFNTRLIDFYVPYSEKGSEARCKVRLSSLDIANSKVLFVLETKEHLDSVLT